jgi:hypothetical protein
MHGNTSTGIASLHEEHNIITDLKLTANPYDSHDYYFNIYYVEKSLAHKFDGVHEFTQEQQSRGFNFREHIPVTPGL